MYFDLHLHPSLKSFLTDTDQERRDDCWHTYRNVLDFTVGNIIDSQASLRQMDNAGIRISVAAMYALEDGLDDISLIRKIAPIISHLDRDMVTDLHPRHYYDRFLEEVRHLESSLEAQGEARPFRIASSADDISEDHNNLLLAIEGAHVLKSAAEDDPLLRLDELKRFRHRIWYITLCHFARTSFCTQAFSMKLVNPRKVMNFLPLGTGLTDEGKAIIKRAYDRTTGRRILIDIKHMSLSTRQQFYAWKRSDPTIADVPLIASHVGVTGLSWAHDVRAAHFKEVNYLASLDQWLVTYEPPAGLELGRMKSHFNPSTINLFDEDIREIVASGGLIGIMMDQRQLGVTKKPSEYFGADDFCKLSEGPNQYERPIPGDNSVFAAASDEEIIDQLFMRENMDVLSLPDLGVDNMISGVSNWVTDLFNAEPEELADNDFTFTGHNPNHTAPRLNRKKRRHLLHICNTLLHVAEVAGAEAWNYVCLGSDFDGLVDAPNNCENVAEFRDLEEHLYDMLMELIEAAGPGSGFRERYHLGDIRWQLRNFMWKNGQRLLEL